MNRNEIIAELESALSGAASASQALSLQRFFPQPVAALGVSNADVARIAAAAVGREPGLTGADWLAIAGHFARSHAHHENLILASALVAKTVRSQAGDDGLLEQLKAWLETDVSNWAQCDDLCIKPLYLYLQRRPALMHNVIDWGGSDHPWCRRASNVGLVKFVGRSPHADLDRILANCQRLLADPDVYVQKGIGWLLKVAAQHETEAVLAFLRKHRAAMAQATVRYAIEKLAAETRREFLR